MKYPLKYLLKIILNPIRTADKIRELRKKNIELAGRVNFLEVEIGPAQQARRQLAKAMDRYQIESNKRIISQSIAGPKVPHEDKLALIEEQARIEREKY